MISAQALEGLGLEEKENRISRLLGVLCVMLVVLFCVPTTAKAQKQPIGIGAILGDPTGISVKVWQSRENAFAGGLAWTLERNSALQVHIDYLWHRYDVIEEARTPVYLGVGGRLRLGDNHSALGVRFPFGITHLLSTIPLDLFIELVPVLELAPSTDFGFEGGIGARFYLGTRRS